jgi:hypothetical protein
MSLSAERERFGARPLHLVEIDLDWVTVAVPATNPDGSPCYRTPATTAGAESLPPGAIGLRTRRFCSTTAPRVWELDAIPCLRDIRVETAQLKVGESLGSFGQVTITLEDLADDDRQEDPFVDQRTPEQLATAAGATYFTKLAARNPYVQGRALRLLSGYATDAYDPANLEVRHYLIRSLKRTNRTTWQLTGVSPLQLANLRGAQAPQPAGWRLATALSATATAATLEDWSLEADDPTSGVCRLGDELCLYQRAGTALTLTRGQYGTEPATFDPGDAVQPALVFTDATIPEILHTLLVEHAGVDPAFVPLADWQAEADIWLAQYRLSPLPISEPTNVIDLINEICEQVGLFLWYDGITRTLRLQALRPVAYDRVRDLSDDDLTTEVSINPDAAERVSRVILLFALRSAVQGADSDAGYRRRLLGQAFGEGPQQHGGPSVKLIKSRWFTESDDALAARTAFTIANQLQDGRTSLSFTLNKRHADLDLGHVIRLTTRDLVDATGQPRPTFCIVVKRTPSRDGLSVDYVVEPFPYVIRYAYAMANDHTATYAATPPAQQDPGWFLCDDSLRMPNGDPAYALS